MKSILNVIDKMNKVVGILVGLMLAAMSVLILIQVFSRFLVDVPFPWTEEAARYLMVYTVFLGSSLALRNHKMIAIEIISEIVGKKLRKILKIVALLISIVFFVLLILEGANILGIVQNQASAAMGITMNIPYMAIPIGAFLMIVNAIAVIIELIINEDMDTSEAAQALKAGENI